MFVKKDILSYLALTLEIRVTCMGERVLNNMMVSIKMIKVSFLFIIKRGEKKFELE